MYLPDNTDLLWVAFGVIVLVMLALDLGVFHRRAHMVQVREAAIWSVTWVVLSLLFNLGVFLWLGKVKGLEFMTSYLIEKSLSLDNIFIWVVIFSDFALPDRYQHRVLFYGILGALILRGAFIAMGVTLLNSFSWLVYIFGAFLIFTALRLVLHRNRAIHLERNPVVLIARRIFPMTRGYEGQNFVVKENGRRMLTPLLLVLLVVESTDIVFALDSVPAVLAVTRDPFIVYTSNVFAILGMRALFFLLAGVLHRVRYLKIGLALLLSFVGAKMLLSNFYEFPILLSLGVISGLLVATVLVSYFKSLQEASDGL